MAIYYHEVREEDHILKNSKGEIVFRGPEHALVTRTFQRVGDGYMTYKSQERMGVPEFLKHLKDLRSESRLGPPVMIPNQRKSGAGRVRGRSVE